MVLTIVELPFIFYVLPLINSKNNINSKTTFELLNWRMEFGEPEEKTLNYFHTTWTLRAVDQIYLESFEMWCWRRINQISWTYRVRNEDVLLRAKEQRSILHEIRKQ